MKVMALMRLEHDGQIHAAPYLMVFGRAFRIGGDGIATLPTAHRRKATLALMDRIGARVVSTANPCPSRDEWNAIREALREEPS